MKSLHIFFFVCILLVLPIVAQTTRSQTTEDIVSNGPLHLSSNGQDDINSMNEGISSIDISIGTNAFSFSDKGQGNEIVNRKVPNKPFHTVIGEGVSRERIVVKFVEGSDIRLRNEKLTSLKGIDLANLHNIFTNYKFSKIYRLFSRPEEDLIYEKNRGQEMSGKELADLNLYYTIWVDNSSNTEAFIDALNRLEIVEIAYPEPIPQLSMANPYDIPPGTPYMVLSQEYLNDPPLGIGATWAWNFSPARGEGIKLIDVEGGWTIDHEDLKLDGSELICGDNSNTFRWRQHGTAMLGMIIGYDNDYGVTGIASKVEVKLASIMNVGIPNAINNAAGYASPGDIILIPLGYGCPSLPNQACLPVEYYEADFNTIQTATANGKIVVEAAGNGSQNLDDPSYNNYFNRNSRDSGAIMVGAGSSSDHSPLSFTNYGSRLDIQGWGENVMTTGYGYTFNGDGDENQYYWTHFSGTSSASSMVAGAAILIQSYLKNVKGYTLNPTSMRQRLAITGTPQTGTNHIGPLPNLKNALQSFVRAEIIGTWNSGFWYYNLATLTWTQMYSSIPIHPMAAIAAGDVTLDGRADVISSWDSGLWYQNGATLLWTKISDSLPSRIAAGDITGDGRAEIIGTWSSGIWYYNLATSAWTNIYPIMPSGPIAAGDVTGDGRADVISCCDDGLWYQNGATLSRTKVSNTVPVGIAAGNITGDSRAEIIVNWGPGGSGISYYNVATENWMNMTSYTPSGPIAAGDVTGDGRADVISCWNDGLWYQDGATFGWTHIYNTAPSLVTVGDITGN